MDDVLALLSRYGYQVVFVWALVVQIGAPVPGAPMLVSAGALAAQGRLSLVACVAAAAGGALLSDLVWYVLGRCQGQKVLALITRMALNPDAAVRRAKDHFMEHRLRYLIAAKFLPGINPLAVALAGAVRLDSSAFFGAAGLGALLWAGTWMSVGYLTSDQLAGLAAVLRNLGPPPLPLVLAALALWIGIRWFRRRRSRRQLLAARITAEELKRRLDQGERLRVVDARAALDLETVPYRIPGAVRVNPRGSAEAPSFGPSETVVFYCSEPNEATSARLVRMARQLGYHDVHPLTGGLEAWRRSGFPLEPLEPAGGVPC